MEEMEKDMGKSCPDEADIIQKRFKSEEMKKVTRSAKSSDFWKICQGSIDSTEKVFETNKEKAETATSEAEKTKSTHKRTRQDKERPMIPRKKIKKIKGAKISKEKTKILKEIPTKGAGNSRKTSKVSRKKTEKSGGTARKGRKRTKYVMHIRSAKRAKIARERTKQSESNPAGSKMRPKALKTAQKKYKLTRTKAVAGEFSPYEEDVVYGPEANLQEHYDNCLKNPKHEQFIPITLFGPQHLPAHYHEESMFELVKTLADLTVRLTVTKVSNNRPETFNSKPYPLFKFRGQDRFVSFGSGRVLQVKKYTVTDGQPCPCSCCKQNSHVQEWAQIRVATATHVVFDDEEAQNTVVVWGYFDDSCQIISFCGISAQGDMEGDVCNLFCATHDLDFADSVARTVEKYKILCQKVFKKYESNREEEKLVIIVSHPHGCPKQISVGQWTNRTDIVKQKLVTVYVDTDESDDNGEEYLNYDATITDNYSDDYYDFDDYNYLYCGNDTDDEIHFDDNGEEYLNYDATITDNYSDDYYDFDDYNYLYFGNETDDESDFENHFNNQSDAQGYHDDYDCDDQNEYNDNNNNCQCDTDYDGENYYNDDYDFDDGNGYDDDSEIENDYNNYSDDDKYYECDPFDNNEDYEFEYYENKKTKSVVNSYTCSKYMYTACTCPGTSGATVFLLGRDDWTSDHLHSLGTADGNCSGFAYKQEL